MLQHAPLPSQHENPLKQDGFRASRSRPGLPFGEPVQPGKYPGRPRLRGLGRPGMAEHQLDAHRQRTIRFPKRLVSGCGSPESPDGGQPAPSLGERARTAAAAQRPAQAPEIGGLKSDPLYVHDHIREAGVHPARPPGCACRKMDACAATLHLPPTRRRAPSMCRAPNVLSRIRPPGRNVRRHSERARSTGSNHGIARLDSMRSMECVESGCRSASPVTCRCRESQRGARVCASCSSAQTGSTDTTSAPRNRRARWRAVAPVPDPRSRILRGRMRMPSRRSSRVSRAICAIRATSGSPSRARANARRTAMRSNTGRIACGIERGCAMAHRVWVRESHASRADGRHRARRIWTVFRVPGQ